MIFIAQRMALVAVLALGTLVPLAGDGLTLEQAVVRALGHNVTYQTAVLAVAQAAAERPDLVHWKALSVSATQKEVSNSTATPTATTSLGLSLPLFDQLSATTSVDQARNTSVTVTATPLAHSAAASQAEIAYQKAVLGAVQARAVVENSTRKAWLAQALAEAQAAAQVRLVGLKQVAYLDSKARFDKAEVTLAEVRAALKDWADARTTQGTFDRALVKARSDLAALVQLESVVLAPLSVVDLQGLVEGMVVDPVVKGTSSSIKVQALEVASQQAKADATWWISPNLTVTGAAGIPASGTTTWNGAVTVSLALGDANPVARQLADRAVSLAQNSLIATQVAARAAESQALLAVQSASAAVESRNLALAQARDLFQETQIQAQAGLATELDLDDAQLGVTTAENDLFSAWADAYGARLDLEAARN